MRFVLVAMLCQISVVYAQVDFEPQVVIVEECGPPKIISNRSTTGDLNLDGLPDLVTTWSEAGLPAEVQVHPGLGGGNFAAPIVLALPPGAAAGTGARGVRVVDMDEDGLPDLVAADSGGLGSRYMVYLGDGGFGLSLISVVDEPGYLPSDVEVCDVTGDGHLDPEQA